MYTVRKKSIRVRVLSRADPLMLAVLILAN